MYMYMCIYIYVYVYVCVFVCMYTSCDEKRFVPDFRAKNHREGRQKCIHLFRGGGLGSTMKMHPTV